MTASNYQKEYATQRVLTASPMELVCILYETGIQAVDQAITAQHAGDVIERGRAVSKAIEVLAELQASLRHDVREEYSRTLAELYTYMRLQLMRAHAEQSLGLLSEVSRLLSTLLEGWRGALKQTRSAPAADSSVTSSDIAVLPNESNPYSPEPVCSGSECRSWQL